MRPTPADESGRPAFYFGPCVWPPSFIAVTGKPACYTRSLCKDPLDRVARVIVAQIPTLQDSEKMKGFWIFPQRSFWAEGVLC